MASYTFADAKSLTDATESELTYWFRLGIIVPDIAGADRTQKKHRRLSLRNLVEAEIAHELARTTPLNVYSISIVLAELRSQDVWTDLADSKEWRRREILRIQFFDSKTALAPEMYGQMGTFWHSTMSIDEAVEALKKNKRTDTVTLINLGNIVRMVESKAGDRL